MWLKPETNRSAIHEEDRVGAGARVGEDTEEAEGMQTQCASLRHTASLAEGFFTGLNLLE